MDRKLLVRYVGAMLPSVVCVKHGRWTRAAGLGGFGALHADDGGNEVVMPVGTLRSFLPPFKLIYKDRLSMREQAERARLEKETKDEAAN